MIVMRALRAAAGVLHAYRQARASLVGSPASSRGRNSGCWPGRFSGVIRT